MKNVKFFSGLLIGIIVGVCILALTKCKSDSSLQEQQVSNSFTMLEDLERLGGPTEKFGEPTVYKLKVDNIQYLVVTYSGTTAIVRHK